MMVFIQVRALSIIYEHDCWQVGSCILFPPQLHRAEVMEDIEVH